MIICIYIFNISEICHKQMSYTYVMWYFYIVSYACLKFPPVFFEGESSFGKCVKYTQDSMLCLTAVSAAVMVSLKPQPTFGCRNGRGITITLQKPFIIYIYICMYKTLGNATSSQVPQATKVPYTPIHNKVATQSTNRDPGWSKLLWHTANKQNLRQV